jgi:hypothetical protein
VNPHRTDVWDPIRGVADLRCQEPDAKCILSRLLLEGFAVFGTGGGERLRLLLTVLAPGTSTNRSVELAV